jgi:hypothetical protein
LRSPINFMCLNLAGIKNQQELRWLIQHIFTGCALFSFQRATFLFSHKEGFMSTNFLQIKNCCPLS